MKINLNSISKFSNPEKYKKVIDMIENNRKNLEVNKAKYSESADYDKILKIHQENKIIVENFRTFLSNRELLMQDILESINKHQESFIKNSNIKELSKILEIESNLENENYSSCLKNIKEIYAKVQENSNIIIIYEIDKKKFHQIIYENHFFNAKSFSYYVNEMKTIFVSGGIRNFSSRREYLKEFYKIQIKTNFDDFEFELITLPSMQNCRASHTMIQHGEYFMAIGGINTKTCEIFDTKENQWSSLPDLPYILANPAVAIVNNNLFVFSGSGSLTSFDGIFKLSLNNLARIIHKEKGFENILDWEKLDYMFKVFNTDKVARLRRGMAALTIGDTIILFGGFDYDNIYDDMYLFQVNLDKRKAENNLSSNQEITTKKNENVKIDKQLLKDMDDSGDEEESANNNEEFKAIEEDEFNEENLYKISEADVELPLKTFFNSNCFKLFIIISRFFFISAVIHIFQ